MASTRPIQFLEDVTCQFIAQALKNSGIDPITAKALSKSACKNIVAPIAEGTERAGGKVVSKVRRRKKNPKQAKALKLANAKLRNKNGKLKKGKTQSDVMKLAQRLRKRM